MLPMFFSPKALKLSIVIDVLISQSLIRINETHPFIVQSVKGWFLHLRDSPFNNSHIHLRESPQAKGLTPFY